MLSPTGTLLIAEAACRANPAPILDKIMEEEAESRHKCKHGSERTSPVKREKEPTSPEWDTTCTGALTGRATSGCGNGAGIGPSLPMNDCRRPKRRTSDLMCWSPT